MDSATLVCLAFANVFRCFVICHVLSSCLFSFFFCTSFCVQYDLHTFPQLLLFRNGHLTSRYRGKRSPEGLAAWFSLMIGDYEVERHLACCFVCSHYRIGVGVPLSRLFYEFFFVLL